MGSSGINAAPVEEKKKPAKKKIVIEEVDSSKDAAPVEEEKQVASHDEGLRKVPASLRRSILSAPRTGYEFERKIQSMNDPSSICEYLDLIALKQLPRLLSQDLSVDILLKVMHGLNGAELRGGLVAGVELLRVLTKLNRFDIILDFLSAEEKCCVAEVFSKLESVEGAGQVRALYQL